MQELQKPLIDNQHPSKLNNFNIRQISSTDARLAHITIFALGVSLAFLFFILVYFSDRFYLRRKSKSISSKKARTSILSTATKLWCSTAQWIHELATSNTIESIRELDG